MLLRGVARAVCGSLASTTTRDLFGISLVWSVTFPAVTGCVSDSERNALSPIIQISDRLVTPGILCSLLSPRKVQRL